MSYYKHGSWNAVCCKCNIEKDETQFYLNSNKKPSKHCKTCHAAYGKMWAQANKDKKDAISKRAREKHYNLCLERSRAWRRNNLEYDAYRRSLYVQQKRNAIPPWADKEKIKDIYLSCPKGYHVDHIIPLRGKLVCGLHVETNLQHLPAQENMRKRNNYDVVL